MGSEFDVPGRKVLQRGFPSCSSPKTNVRPSSSILGGYDGGCEAALPTFSCAALSAPFQIYMGCLVSNASLQI